MIETTTFPKHLSATLDVKDKILTIFKKNDLLEVICLKNLEDDWNEVTIEKEIYDLNLFKDRNEWKLNIHSIEDFEEENLTNPYNFKNINLKTCP